MPEKSRKPQETYEIIKSEKSRTAWVTRETQYRRQSMRIARTAKTSKANDNEAARRSDENGVTHKAPNAVKTTRSQSTGNYQILRTPRNLRGREVNPGLPRDRRKYQPLYYRGFKPRDRQTRGIPGDKENAKQFGNRENRVKQTT